MRRVSASREAARFMKESLLGQPDAGHGLLVESPHLTAQSNSHRVQSLAHFPTYYRTFNADLIPELQNLQLDPVDASRQSLQAFHFSFEN